jgi:hypothetical protein
MEKLNAKKDNKKLSYEEQKKQESDGYNALQKGIFSFQDIQSEKLEKLANVLQVIANKDNSYKDILGKISEEIKLVANQEKAKI